MFLLLALMMAPQTTAQASAQPAVPATAPAATATEKLICKRYASAGSNIASNKKCLTRAQWDAVARQSQSVRRSMEQSWTTPNGF
jgi:hypothetical protein